MGALCNRRAWWLGPVLALAWLLLAAGAGARTEAAGRQGTAKATGLPTWDNLYDWPNGNGYAGWHDATSSTDDYGRQAALGDRYGLWLWPVGGHKTYDGGDYAEWTYTAPGPNRIAAATLSYAWSNKLLAHHCIDVGLRDGAGAIVDRHEACKPPPQSPVTVSLADPAPNPTAKVLYFRIRVDCGGASDCSKTIPALDPLDNGAFARLLQADMTIVDDDTPQLLPSGPFFELNGQYIDGQGTYDLTNLAIDQGSGITQASLARSGDGTLGSQSAPCDPTHHTDALDNRICPAQFSYTESVSTTGLPEGLDFFNTSASDVAGNAADSLSWGIFVDRTAPPAPDGIVVDSYDAAGSTATIAWPPVDDPYLADGFPGSGLDHYDYRYAVGGGAWTDWSAADDAQFDVAGVQPSDTIAVEVRAVDAVGNASDVATATLQASTTGSVTPTGDLTASPLDEDQTTAAEPGPTAEPPDAISPAGPVSLRPLEYLPADESGVDGGLQVITETADGTFALTGAVVNSSTGQPIPTATVTLTGNGQSLTTQVNVDGAFAFVDVPTAAGGYDLAITAPGFGPYELTNWSMPTAGAFSDTYALGSEPQTIDATGSWDPAPDGYAPPEIFSTRAAIASDLCGSGGIPQQPSTLRYDSNQHPPPTIKVLVCPLDATGSWTGGAPRPRTFRWSFYIRKTLQSEIDASYGTEASIAQGVAAQSFAWYWRAHHRTAAGAVDVVNTQQDQAFLRPGRGWSSLWTSALFHTIFTTRLLAPAQGGTDLHVMLAHFASGQSSPRCSMQVTGVGWESMNQSAMRRHDPTYTEGGKRVCSALTWDEMISRAYSGTLPSGKPDPEHGPVSILPVLRPGETDIRAKQNTFADGLPQTHYARLKDGSVVLGFVSRFTDNGGHVSTIGWDYVIDRCSVDAAGGEYGNCAKKNLWTNAERTSKYALPRLYFHFTPSACAWYHVRAVNPAGSSPYVAFRTDNDLGTNPAATRPQEICPKK